VASASSVGCQECILARRLTPGFSTNGTLRKVCRLWMIHHEGDDEVEISGLNKNLGKEFEVKLDQLK
jgi:hypothetical protein